MESSVPVAIKMRCIERIEQGQPVLEVARLFGFSRQVLYKWRGPYQAEGPAGLTDHSRRPHTSPQRLAARLVRQILQLRQRERIGPLRIALRLGLSQASVYQTLCRHGRQHLRPKRRRVIHRYEKSAPGELLHLDVKELVPLWRGTPPEQQFAVLDDYSWEVFSHIYPGATTRAATDFLRAAVRYYRYPVAAVLTDNAFCFTMRLAAHAERTTLFARTCAELGIRDQVLRPYHPETNGKVKRFFRTVAEECYEHIHFRGSAHRATALQAFMRYYNHDRPHLGLGVLTPVARWQQYFELSTMS